MNLYRKNKELKSIDPYPLSLLSDYCEAGLKIDEAFITYSCIHFNYRATKVQRKLYSDLMKNVHSRNSFHLLNSIVIWYKQDLEKDNKLYNSIKEKLKNRKRGTRKPRDSILNTNLTEDEKKEVELAINAEEAAEKAEQIAAILAVTGQLTDIKTRDGEKRLMGDLVESSQLSAAEKDELVSKLLEQQRQADEQQNSKKEYANASLLAKLEARRRLRQEKAKEDALRKEMDSLSENRVSVNMHCCNGM